MKIVSAAALLSLLATNEAIVPQCPKGSMLLRFDFHAQLGFFGSENTWSLANNCQGGAVLASGGPYTDGDFPEIELAWCLNPYNEYTFTMFDAWGDGIDEFFTPPPGVDLGYSLIWDGDILVDDSQFLAPTLPFPDPSLEATMFGNPICRGPSMIIPIPAGGFGDPHCK